MFLALVALICGFALGYWQCQNDCKEFMRRADELCDLLLELPKREDEPTRGGGET